MKYTNEKIIERFNNNETLKFLYFWGHQPNKDESIGKSCFSQWWEASFEIEGISYPTAEHYMMAGKARLFNDDEILQEILSVKHPHNVKKLGRKVKNFSPEQWNEHKFDIVLQANHAKFSQNQSLKEYLLNTKDRIIVEASPVDPIWGIGMASDNPNITNPNNWQGDNLLGYALMEVREQLTF
ncbi:NADAR family protein [uncultured Tenacibaculum sp.]|uniref:NADAR family protein n=1 Tax=uncultured Tenacibaculum sp. TaxID=174713 RepID=UPI0026172633|nr:NADAR family protein [uncultured Tenacibaculum sp.]